MMVGMQPPPSILALMHRPWLVASLLGLVAVLVFSPAVFYDFVNWDDDRYVYENPLVLGGLSPAGVSDAVTQTVFGFWAPLTILSYQFDASVFGKAPWGLHLTNVLLHAAEATQPWRMVAPCTCLLAALALVVRCESHSRLCQLFLKNGQLGNAVEEFRTVQTIDPQYPGILNLLNRALEEQSRRNASPGRSPP
jgi:hypothetical protein